MIILDEDFPNAPILGRLEEDPAEGDTEYLESMSGVAWANSRRSVLPRRFRFQLWGEESDDVILAAIAVKEAALGRTYGFKWTNPRTAEEIDVCFTEDGWMLTMEGGATDPTVAYYTINVQLKEVIGGVPAP
jgi:hypothetical protein